VTFPHVHDVHDVHAYDWRLNFQRSNPIAGLIAFTPTTAKTAIVGSPSRLDIRFSKIGCIALLHRVEASSQAKQGAVVDVLWNQ
jgi:hypothetical protein